MNKVLRVRFAAAFRLLLPFMPAQIGEADFGRDCKNILQS
jgi:hypothetical protein